MEQLVRLERGRTPYNLRSFYDGCYSLAPGPVILMLVISHPDKDEFAIVEQVLSDVDNAKSRCFQKTYNGIRTKVPPFLPFVLQLGMG